MAAATATAATSLFTPSSSSSSSSSSPANKPKSFIHSSSNVCRFPHQKTTRFLLSSFRTTAIASAAAAGQILEKSHDSASSSSSSSTTTRDSSSSHPKVDKSGRFCSPRAARELALSIIYTACIEGNDPIRLFEKRVNARTESGYEFDKSSLMEYNHMSFGGPPVITKTIEEANNLLRIDAKASEIEAEVLAAPPKLVYSKLILRFTRKLLVAVVQKWDSNVVTIDKIVPPSWKNGPQGKILELSLLHLAMSEITVLETRHQIVINEAVDLAKRFCDGAAPRIVNGCLRTFVKDLEGSSKVENVETKLAAPAAEMQN